MKTHKRRRLLIIACAALILSIAVPIVAALIVPLSFALSLSPAICPGAIYAVDTPEPVVALTIDDGPDDRPDSAIAPGNQNTTVQILNVLSAHQAQATFFLLSHKIENRDRATRNPDPLVSRIVRDGHEIGNHLTQDRRSIGLGNQFEAKLLEAQTIIDRYTQPHTANLSSTQTPSASPRWLRPGGGWCSNPMADIARKHRYNLVLGLIWPLDTHIPWSGFAQRFIQWNIRPGAIIILHDGGQNGERGQRTAKTLERVLSRLDNRYRVTTLSELLTYGDAIANPTPFPPLLDPLRQHLILTLFPDPPQVR